MRASPRRCFPEITPVGVSEHFPVVRIENWNVSQSLNKLPNSSVMQLLFTLAQHKVLSTIDN